MAKRLWIGYLYRGRYDTSPIGTAKQYYHRLGRVWKQYFLLYSPSDTEKLSFVTATANFLSYVVYYIDLC
ncbi:hypothetical protein JHK85_040091 [Glycine max]|nr:hypothetical protein JHK86_039512 [Glycine max]KAG4965116.1 hypothetical protein JHK85_040091 [Glycine max]